MLIIHIYVGHNVHFILIQLKLWIFTFGQNIGWNGMNTNLWVGNSQHIFFLFVHCPDISNLCIIGDWSPVKLSAFTEWLQLPSVARCSVLSRMQELWVGGGGGATAPPYLARFNISPMVLHGLNELKPFLPLQLWESSCALVLCS